MDSTTINRNDRVCVERRLRILRVSSEMMYHIRANLNDMDGLRRVLLLPDGASVVDVSLHQFFQRDEAAVKIVSPDFPVVPKGERIPVGTVRYRIGENGAVEFDGWEGFDDD